MDINDLQKAWKKVSSDTSEREVLTEEKIRELLSTRTSSLMERIDRNIRGGLVVLFLIIALIVVWDFLVTGSDALSGRQVHIPLWVTLLDRGINFLLFLLFLVFVVRYNQIRRKCEDGCSLRQALVRVIGIMETYKRLFALALVIFLLSSGTGYIAGFYKGIHIQEYTGLLLPVAIILGILTLLLFTGLLFLLLRWMFRKLYGNYLNQLRKTLRELDELDELD